MAFVCNTDVKYDRTKRANELDYEAKRGMEKTTAKASEKDWSKSELCIRTLDWDSNRSAATGITSSYSSAR